MSDKEEEKAEEEEEEESFTLQEATQPETFIISRLQSLDIATRRLH